MLLDSQKAAAAWKQKFDSCSVSLLQMQLQEIQSVLEQERAAASREREATALITKQQELALMETEGSKRTLLVSNDHEA